MPSAPMGLVHFRVPQVSVLIDLSDSGLPVLRHWGTPLGRLATRDSETLRRGLPGRPIDVELKGFRTGPEVGEGFTMVSSHLEGGSAGTTVGADAVPEADEVYETGANTLIWRGVDHRAGLTLTLTIQVTDDGLLRLQAELSNTAQDPFHVVDLSMSVPVCAVRVEHLELDTARPTTLPLAVGSSVVSGGWQGITGLVERREIGGAVGAVRLVRVDFPGAVAPRVQRSCSVTTWLGGGESLEPGDIVLRPETSYSTPWIEWAWAPDLDAALARLHDHQPTPEGSDPVLFSAAGALVADLDVKGVVALADYAAAIGAEGFVIDLDWCVQNELHPWGDTDTNPDSPAVTSLEGLLERIRDTRAAPGFALDPEWVPADDRICAEHPEWLIDGPDEPGGGRHLDLAQRSAVLVLWERLTKLLDRHSVSTLVFRRTAATVDRTIGRRRVLARQRLLDALGERYPALSIIEAEPDGPMSGEQPALAAHSVRVHTTARRRTLRSGPTATPDEFATAVLGGINLAVNLPDLSAEELRSMARWLSLHKQFRARLRGGTVVRQSDADGSLLGVIAADDSAAAFASTGNGGRRVALTGLHPRRLFRLTGFTGERPTPDDEGTVLPGAVFAAGVVVPDAPLLVLEAVDA